MIFNFIIFMKFMVHYLDYKLNFRMIFDSINYLFNYFQSIVVLLKEFDLDLRTCMTPL